MSAARPREAARAERLTLGAIWAYQGIVPKWLGQLPFELEIIRRSALYFVSPEWMLAAVGGIELAIGLWLLSGRGPHLAALAATGCMLALQMIVLWVEPTLLLGPFGGIVKNAALVLLAWRIWQGAARSPIRNAA